MKDRVFIDTNIFVYTQSSVEIAKREISLNAIANHDCYASTQILNEVSADNLQIVNIFKEEIN